MKKPPYIDESQWSNILYFWRESDLRRMTDWGECLTLLRQNGHPLAIAYDQMVAAQLAVNYMIGRPVFDEEDEE